jgi:hypothetical protein
MVEPEPRKVKLVRKGVLLVAVAQPRDEPLTHAQTIKAIRELRAQRDSALRRSLCTVNSS